MGEHQAEGSGDPVGVWGLYTAGSTRILSRIGGRWKLKERVHCNTVFMPWPSV